MSAMQDVQGALRRVRQVVLRMLPILEDPQSTSAEKDRARGMIDEAFEDPEGVGLGELTLEAGNSGTGSAGDEAGQISCGPNSLESAFWDKLQQIMKAKVVTQAQLAARLGLSQPAVSQLFSRKCRPQRTTILNLAEALEVEPCELWPDLEVAGILDTVAAVQEDQEMTDAEAEAIRRQLDRPASNAPAAPLPKRKR